MKYILISLLFILGGCSAVGTSGGKESYAGAAQFDTNKLHCPARTMTVCEGPNRKNLTCKCVRNIKIQPLDFQQMGTPF